MIPILKKTSQFVVWDKPSGLVVNRAKTVAGLNLMDYIRRRRLIAERYRGATTFWRRQGVVHRLDKDASGIVLQARQPGLFAFWQEQFRRHRVKKRYLVLVWGDIDRQGAINFPLQKQPPQRRYPIQVASQGKPARTLYWRQRQWRWQGKTLSLVLVQTLTGRTHQIRAHFRYLGFPLWADPIYGLYRHQERQLGGRLFLHATFLQVALPDGRQLTVASPLPNDLKEIILKLDKNAVAKTTD